jgi:hypothetical protein
VELLAQMDYASLLLSKEEVSRAAEAYRYLKAHNQHHQAPALKHLLESQVALRKQQQKLSALGGEDALTSTLSESKDIQVRVCLLKDKLARFRSNLAINPTATELAFTYMVNIAINSGRNLNFWPRLG